MKRLIVIGALLIAALASTGAAMAQDASMMNTITVSGIGTAYGEPDVVYIQLGVDRVDADLGKAFSDAGTTMSAIMDALMGLGIQRADIQTSGINVYPQDRYDPSGTTAQRVYQVSNIVQVTVRDVAQVESVITAAVGAGANALYNLNFGIADTAAVESTARTAAVSDARARADQLAAALGVTVGAPVMIAEVVGGGGAVPLPYAAGGMRAMSAEMAAPVSPGQLSVTVQVTISFAIGA
jgi:hypothetical protein